jgi:hypothetical protein
MKTTSREKLLSYFAAIVGGWDASPPIHTGRLQSSLAIEDYEDDEKVAHYLLDEYADSKTAPLQSEIQRLKSEMYHSNKREKVLRDALIYVQEPLLIIGKLGHCPQGGEQTGNQIHIWEAEKIIKKALATK